MNQTDYTVSTIGVLQAFVSFCELAKTGAPKSYNLTLDLIRSPPAILSCVNLILRIHPTWHAGYEAGAAQARYVVNDVLVSTGESYE